MTFDPRNFNPSEHEGGGVGDTLPIGEYVAMVKGFKRHVRRGKNQIDLTVKAVLDANQRRVSDDYLPIWETITIQENAIWRLVNLCNAIGHNSPFNINDDREFSGAVKGKPFKIRVTHETYNGEKKARIKGYANLSSDDVKAFEEALEDMSIDGSTDNYDSSDDYSSNNSSSDSGDDFTDDDIPF